MSDLIDRQEAIDFIDAGHLCNPNEPRWSDNEIVNFLKSRPSAQPETHEERTETHACDCISRREAIDAIVNELDNIDHVPEWVFDRIKSVFHKLPSAQPERKTGKWIEQDDGWDGVYYECSVCKEAFTLIDGTPSDNLYNFCPNCGCKMEVEHE